MVRIWRSLASLHWTCVFVARRVVFMICPSFYPHGCCTATASTLRKGLLRNPGRDFQENNKFGSCCADCAYRAPPTLAVTLRMAFLAAPFRIAFLAFPFRIAFLTAPLPLLLFCFLITFLAVAFRIVFSSCYVLNRVSYCSVSNGFSHWSVPNRP